MADALLFFEVELGALVEGDGERGIGVDDGAAAVANEDTIAGQEIEIGTDGDGRDAENA
jgi:hypothetical protein